VLKRAEGKKERLTKELEKVKRNQDQYIYGKRLLQEAAEFYFSKGQLDLTFEDKKSLIRHFVREIRVYEDRIQIYTF
jgi:site-specific DNA recombinase